MGARQSVAQPPSRQSAPSSADQGLTSLSSPTSNGNHATSSNDAASASTSTGISGGARPRIILHPTTSTTSHHYNRSRQQRSRSMTTSTMTPTNQIPTVDAAAFIAALNQQRRRANRLLLDTDTGGGGGGHSSDLSSDSGDDNDTTMTANTIRSLDRLLRLNSLTTETQNLSVSAGGGPRLWVPPISFRYFDVKCPICNKTIPFDDVEYHLVVCFTRPRIAYNEEVLSEDRDGECVICFDEMSQGDTIARLPCLCVYHKTCIDGWFKVKNCCPAHPGDDD